MLRQAIWLLCSLALISCSTQPVKHVGTQAAAVGSTGVLHLHCTWIEPWCGGAEPDHSEWPRTTTWSGKMYIRIARPDSSGKLALNDLRQPILDTIHMNAEGDGYMVLPAGKFLLLDQDRIDDRRYKQLLRDFRKPALYQEPIDTDCLRHWLYGPFDVLTITANDTLHHELARSGQCPWYATPCVSYTGPLLP